MQGLGETVGIQGILTQRATLKVQTWEGKEARGQFALRPGYSRPGNECPPTDRDDGPHRWPPDCRPRFPSLTLALNPFDGPGWASKDGNVSAPHVPLLVYRSGWLCSPLPWRSIRGKHCVACVVGIEHLKGLE